MEPTNPENSQNPKSAELDSIANHIDMVCNGPDGEGVWLFPSSIRLSENPTIQEREEYAANAVYDGLMTTLGEIGAYTLKRAKGNDEIAKDYETVLHAMDIIASACRALAEGRLPLKKNGYQEQEHAAVGDRVYAYKSGPFNLDGIGYRGAKVFIRPKKYIQPTEMKKKPNANVREVQEYSQARMSISLLSQDASMGEVNLRVDREDALRDYEITYDIEVRPNGENILSRLDFSTENDDSAQLGRQREGHHFSSHYRAEDFGLTFSDILETFNRRIEQSIAVLPTPNSFVTNTPSKV